MRRTQKAYRAREVELCAALLFAFTIGGCSSGKQASQMTSFSAQSSQSQTPELFTIPQDQMSHVQIVTR